ncbi:hypothetical protein E2C01_065421 [Portunus trituberculatus]|uniref:Uncharacterized protein n=1 Tax=Portunus trituberculatus TaxID=210409 RepID=A0A5B7HIS9_PORTR|nr:hypothetical protein [Portunus trituberculatus]
MTSGRWRPRPGGASHVAPLTHTTDKQKRRQLCSKQESRGSSAPLHTLPPPLAPSPRKDGSDHY